MSGSRLFADDGGMRSIAADARYQIRIQLDNVRPPIWREVIVPANISLPWLHEVIQEAMGWLDCHLHQFVHQGTYYVTETGEDWGDGVDEAGVSLGQLLKKVGDKLSYEYDFGDGWEHAVSVKKILPPDASEPLSCLKGKGACPPEDCGGPWGYMDLCALLESVRKGKRLSEEDRERLQWFALEIDDSFAPEDLEDVNESFEKMQKHVAAGGGFGVGGAPLPEGVFKPYEGGADEDFGEILGELSGEAEPPEAEFPLFEESTEEEFPEPYSELGSAECVAFKAAMAGAVELREQEPWKTLHDCDIFGIEDPETGGIHVVSVLGAVKEVFSVQVHRAPYALGFWREALSEPGEMDTGAVLHRASIIEAEFCNKAEMDEPDLALYERIAFKTPPRGRKRWVRLRTYRPRTFPWFPQAEELSQLGLGMRLCRRYLELVATAEDPGSFLMEPDAEKGLPPSLKVFRLPNGAKPSETEKWVLSDVAIHWESCEPPRVPYEPSEFELHQLAELPKEPSVWELGAIFLPSPAMTATGPVLPVLAIALEVTLPHPPQPYLSTNLEASPTQVLWECLKERVLDAEALPSEIHVSTDAAEATLKEFAELAGVKVRRVKSLPLLGALFQSMAGGM